MLPPETKAKTLRWFILRTLLKKEISRHLANRGGLILAGLLIVVALLSSQFGQNTKGIETGNLTASVHNCFVDYWQKDAWVKHLEENVPTELSGSLRFRQITRTMGDNEQIVYPPGTGAIQIRPNGIEAGQSRYLIWLWQPSGDENGLAPFESWFWKESYSFFQEQAAPILAESGDLATQAPILEQRRTALTGGLDAKTGITTALVLFAVFFVCVYLLPSLTLRRAAKRQRRPGGSGPVARHSPRDPRRQVSLLPHRWHGPGFSSRRIESTECSKAAILLVRAHRFSLRLAWRGYEHCQPG